MDHASYVFPSGEPGRLNMQASSQLVTMLNWAMSPHVKRMNMAFVLIDEKKSDLSERLTGNPHVATLEVPLPDQAARETFITSTTVDTPVAGFSDFGAPELAKLTAGISLTDLNVLLQSARESGKRLDAAAFRGLKKRLLERQCQGLLEFIEPKWTLDTVVGHEAAKTRLREDAALLKRGALDSMPMGYLLCGPVGTGKSFLAQCVSGEIGVPCVMLKNFRSKYVGETEGNLERVLAVLRAMGPVVVVVDEADAALGSREQEGDSGTSSRVFAMIASQMGDSRYRGQIIWMLLTARPDLLPIDLKRQGRAEVHIPLFYPTDEAEIRQMFVILAKKLGSRIAVEDVPAIPQRGHLSGADIEGMVGRALRSSILAGADHITRESLATVVAEFMPSTQGLERELQETAAILECTDRQFLPPAILHKTESAGGRGALQERLTALKQLVRNL
jgi:SpoVK/Ycf46/Vps4 family AAA+-type ATPase